MKLAAANTDTVSILETAGNVLAYLSCATLYSIDIEMNEQEKLGLSAILDGVKEMVDQAMKKAA